MARRMAFALTTVAVLALMVPLPARADTGRTSGAVVESPGLAYQDLTDSLTPADVVSALVGSGVTVSNVVYAGADGAAGTFSGGGTAPSGIIGFDQGIVLSTGTVAGVVGPNSSDAISTGNGQPGDASLDGLLPAGQSTQDAAVLTFDFVPDASQITFHYVFASDEYNEYVGSGYNDVFGFFVNGTNCATVGGSPVSIDTINLTTNSGMYRNNERDDSGTAPIDTEMDGLTTVLTCQATVTPAETNTMKLAIGDVGDSAVDSNVFIQAGSLTTGGDVPGAPTDVAAFPSNASAVVSWNPPASDGGSPIDSYEVTCTATGNPDDTHVVTTDGTATAVSVAGLTNGTEYTCTVRAHNAAGVGASSDASNPVTPSDASVAAVVDPSQGGILRLTPTTSRMGTTGRLVLPPQSAAPEAASGTNLVVVTAALFGQPGEIDPTCGGHTCVGQGIDWNLSDLSAFEVLKVVFKESRKLAGDLDVKTVPVYKNGTALPRCTYSNIPPTEPGACVKRRDLLPNGGWRVVILALGADPKGRI